MWLGDLFRWRGVDLDKQLDRQMDENSRSFVRGDDCWIFDQTRALAR